MKMDFEAPLREILDGIDVEMSKLSYMRAGIEMALEFSATLPVGDDVKVTVSGTGVLSYKAETLAEAVPEPQNEMPPVVPRPDEVPKFLKNQPKRLKQQPVPDPLAKPEPVEGGASKFRAAWSDHDLLVLREMTEAGKPAAAIAEALGRTVATIYTQRSALGISPGAKKPAAVAPARENKTKVVGQASSGMPATPKAPPRTVLRPGPEDADWSVFDDLELVRMFSTGSNKAEIAIILERSPTEVVARFVALTNGGPTPAKQAALIEDLTILRDRQMDGEAVA